jgi:hypothetical protein
MAQIFTANQVNHAYVVNTLSDIKPTKTSALGTSYIGKTQNGSIYLMQKGQGGLVRSDMIDLDKIMYVNYTLAEDMERAKNAALITVNPAALNSGKVIAGEDYILRLVFQNPIGISPDHTYWKQGVVHATTDMTASQFYAKMAMSLYKNFSREAVKLVDIYLTTSGADVEITSASQALSGTYTGIKIVEATQDWELGIKQDKPIIFKINASTITKDKVDIVWTDVVYSTGLKMTGGEEPSTSVVTSGIPSGGKVPNGHLAAELEYFSMGERADYYRTFPNAITTKFLVDPSKKYDMINIHYFFVGDNHASQKSEKDITLIVPSDKTGTLGNVASAIKTKLDSIIAPDTNVEGE